MGKWPACAVVLGVLLLPATSAGGSSARGCFPAGSKGVARGPGARIFWLSGYRGYYGCLLSTGQPVALADEGTDPRRPFRLAGHLAVYSSQQDPIADEDVSYVSIQDLRSTKSLPVSYDAGPYRSRLTKLVVTPDASFAFVSRWSNADGSETLRVGKRRSASHGNTTVLAEGPSINALSLAIRDGRVFWREDGREKSARL